MRNIFIALLVIFAFNVATTPEVVAQEKKSTFNVFRSKRTVAKEKKEKEENKSDYEKLFSKEHKKREGMITLHELEGKLFFEFPIDLLGREMMIGSTISKISDNSHAVVGSKPTYPLHVTFTKNDTHVQLREVNTGYITEGSFSDPLYSGSHIPSILENMKILAYSPDSTAVVFDMTSFFVGDNKKMPAFDDVTLLGGGVVRTENYSAKNSYLSDIKAFSDNVSITSVLSYTYSLSLRNGLVLDQDAPFTAEMTRSIVLLNEEPYRPRLADYRMAIFNTRRTILGSGPKTSRSVYFTNRWDLQPANPEAFQRGELVEPIKPIVFYIDNTFPQEWLPYIREGVLQWNELFEEIGFKDAIRVADFPVDDPEFDPDNIKYSCIRYAPSNFQNAMGPSWVDPRSGEIITASVYVYHDVVKLIRQWLFVQTAQLNPEIRTVDTPMHLLGDALRYVLSHEVGHCLGLMHNMSASHTIPVDSLRSVAYTQEHGTTKSIMDYARFNYVAQPEDKGVRLMPPRFGEYDRFSIKWNYTPIFGVDDIREEEKITADWVTEALKKDFATYSYGKQQFYGILDPRSQSEDLGDDAVKATQYGVKNLKYITAHLDEWIDKEDDDFEFRNSIYRGILEQLLTYVGHVAGNVGGYYSNEVRGFDEMERYLPIPADKQRAALKYLIELFGDLDFLDEAPLLKKTSVSGSPKSLIQAYISRLLFRMPIQVSSYELMSPDSFQSSEAFDIIFDFVWNDGEAKSPNINDEYATLQRSYLEEMLSIVTTTSMTHPSGVVSLVSPEQLKLELFGADFFSRPYECTCHAASSAHGQESFDGTTSGFEKVPNNQFVAPRTKKADIYAYVMKAKSLIQSRINSTTGKAKNHYRVLLNMIETTLK